MFFDFSSAFNTIQPHLLPEKLLKMKVSIPAILWVLDYLTDRPLLNMALNFPTSCSPTLALPKRLYCHLLFFSLYTADRRSSHDSCPIDKFADDTGLTGLITNDDDFHYRQGVDNLLIGAGITIWY